MRRHFRAPGPVLTDLARLFLKLGLTAFGGPAVHIALMEDEVVRRRGWLSREAFLDYLGATNLIPGPNSTELAIHIGYARAGWPGLLVAGACFILPATLITGALAWVYVRFGTLPQVEGILYGVKPVVIGIVLQALWGLGRTALTSRGLALLGTAALVAAAAGLHELLVLAGAGALMALVADRGPAPGRPVHGWLPPAGLVAASADATPAGALAGLPLMAVATPAITPWGVFGVFAKIGSVLFGSGYVLLAFLRTELVERRGWLAEAQLLDAVAVGQLTPGPVFSTATFVGYLIGGGTGATAATIGIFLPAFVFVALSGPLIPRLRRSPRGAAALNGINVASLALLVLVTVELGRAAIVDVVSLLLAVGSLALLVGRRVNTAWLIVAGALVGALVRGLR